MGRLIDADAFDKRVRLDVGLCEEELTEDFKDGISTILEMMKTAPAVDAKKVVRCGKCKYVGTDATCCLVCDREGMGLRPFHVHHDDYCSYGERKDGDHHE